MTDTDTAPIAPERPADGECCESGCGDACVWQKYYVARTAFEQAQREWQARHPEAEAPKS